MTVAITRFIRDESGATAIEYALIAGTISIVIPAAQKEAPATLEGAHGAEGLLWAEHVRTTRT
jgi:pilus assembly protein Flp/PilA